MSVPTAVEIRLSALEAAYHTGNWAAFTPDLKPKTWAGIRKSFTGIAFIDSDEPELQYYVNGQFVVGIPL